MKKIKLIITILILSLILTSCGLFNNHPNRGEGHRNGEPCVSRI